MTKERILADIRRTAEANGGKPLGRQRFAAETGIREADWAGVYWARWGDAIREAGFEPNVLQGRFEDDAVLERLAALIRRYGKLPTETELRLERRADPMFPSAGVFERFGPKPAWAARVADFCGDRPDLADVLEIVKPLIVDDPVRDEEVEPKPRDLGFVYLLKSGRHYKVGRTNSVGRRTYDVALQLPDPVERVHEISTDDPAGIEAYWHRRFADRRKNGEWFELSAADVSAFKRRRFQ